jgi:hypothetical protein
VVRVELFISPSPAADKVEVEETLRLRTGSSSTDCRSGTTGADSEAEVREAQEEGEEGGGEQEGEEE